MDYWRRTALWQQMDSDNCIPDQHAVEPYVTHSRGKDANDCGLLVTGLGKHLPNKLWISSALIVGPNAGASSDLIPAAEQGGLRGRRTLIQQVIPDIRTSHESEHQYS